MRSGASRNIYIKYDSFSIRIWMEMNSWAWSQTYIKYDDFSDKLQSENELGSLEPDAYHDDSSIEIYI